MVGNYKNKYIEKEKENQRNLMKFRLLNQWLRLKIQGVHFKEFFEDRKLSSVAIYGMGEIGWLVYEELKADGWEQAVRYGIDQSGKRKENGVGIYPLCSSLKKTDAIIITPVLVTDFIEDAIYEKLGEQTTFTVEEILYELSRKHRVLSMLWEI